MKSGQNPEELILKAKAKKTTLPQALKEYMNPFAGEPVNKGKK